MDKEAKVLFHIEGAIVATITIVLALLTLNDFFFATLSRLGLMLPLILVLYVYLFSKLWVSAGMAIKRLRTRSPRL